MKEGVKNRRVSLKTSCREESPLQPEEGRQTETGSMLVQRWMERVVPPEHMCFYRTSCECVRMVFFTAFVRGLMHSESWNIKGWVPAGQNNWCEKNRLHVSTSLWITRSMKRVLPPWWCQIMTENQAVQKTWNRHQTVWFKCRNQRSSVLLI